MDTRLESSSASRIPIRLDYASPGTQRGPLRDRIYHSLFAGVFVGSIALAAYGIWETYSAAYAARWMVPFSGGCGTGQIRAETRLHIAGASVLLSLVIAAGFVRRGWMRVAFDLAVVAFGFHVIIAIWLRMQN